MADGVADDPGEGPEMTARYLHTLSRWGRVYRCPCGLHIREARLTEPCIGCGRIHSTGADAR